MTDINIFAIEAFSDNYIWCLNDGQNAVVVDPGQAKPVLDALQSRNLNLIQILVTHHHPDHVGGIAELRKVFVDVLVIGYEKASYQGLDVHLKDNEAFDVMGKSFEMFTVPGHTLDHVAFYCSQLSALFPGDTLFSAGCGRLFEGTPGQMYKSLQKIMKLPGNTGIYCAHEYTLSNLEFARDLMPTNSDLSNYQEQCRELRQKGTPTLPSSLALESRINPFLRQNDHELIENLMRLNYTSLEDPESILAATRDAKDKY